jgi:Domain of unknown function (DUF5107)
MPVDVRTDEITLSVMALNAIPPDETKSYPYGRLESSGRALEHAFQSVVIENEYLMVTIVPALGGRVVRLQHRSGEDFLPWEGRPKVTVGGKRGVEVACGIELTLDGDRQLTALGPCLAQLAPAREDDEPGGVWVAQSATGTGLSFHLGYFLDPGSATLRVEARIYNRNWHAAPYNAGLVVDGGLKNWGWDASEAFRSISDEQIQRFGAPRLLQPRQVDGWTVNLTPFRPVSADAEKNSEGAIDFGFTPDNQRFVRIQTSKVRLQHRLVILTADGQTLESPVDLYPEHALEIPLGELVAAGAALIGPDGGVLIGSRQKPEEPRFDPFDAGTRHAAHAFDAVSALQANQFEKAAEQFERSLLYNADDPLAWWGQAFALRLVNPEGAQDGNLANAHYLAPLEPVLRAEAILTQDAADSTGPNPLLAPLAVTPEAFVVVACQLLETGQLTEASRWISESLLHADLPMLHYLLADIYLSSTRLVVEAAQHIAQAGRIGFQPPYPFARQEFDALERLANRFPQDSVLQQFNALRQFSSEMTS